MLESILARHGHEVIGVTDSTAMATDLVVHGQPDGVIVDLSLGYNTDFDVVGAAVTAGARTIVFSYNADETELSRYSPRPIVIAKPDFTTLELTIEHLFEEHDAASVETDRRRNPVRAASGPPPTGIGDAQTFYEAVNGASGGDAFVSLDWGGPSDVATAIGEAVVEVIRATDRLVASPVSVKVYLAGADVEGLGSFLARLREVITLPVETVIRSIVVDADENPMDAFDRMKHSDALHG